MDDGFPDNELSTGGLGGGNPLVSSDTLALSFTETGRCCLLSEILRLESSLKLG